MMRCTGPITLVIALAVLTSCGGGDTGDAHDHDHDHADPPAQQSEIRIHVDDRVRRNLGITLVEVVSGRLMRTASYAGALVTHPERSWTVHAPLAGTVTALASPWQKVARNDLVAEIAGAALGEWQADLHAELARAEEARLELETLRAGAAPAERLATTLATESAAARESVTEWRSALAQTRRAAETATGRLAELRRLRESDAVSAAALIEAERLASSVGNDVASHVESLRAANIAASELDVRARAARNTVDQFERRVAILERRVVAARSAYSRRLEAIAAACGIAASDLEKVQDGRPAWETMSRVAIRAPADGIVFRILSRRGTWCERDDELLAIFDPSKVVFSARIPESAAATLPAELLVKIAAAGVDGPRFAASAALRPVADEVTRSVFLDAVLDNADGALRPGVSALAEVSLDAAREKRLLVPGECVVRDGLDSVVFIQDEDDPHDVIRQAVVLGDSSGGMTEILAGVDLGARIVRRGANQLRHADADDESGGHVHADGTWHEGH